MAKKQIILLADTETLTIHRKGAKGEQVLYDLGYLIISRKDGILYSFNGLNRSIFRNEKLMDSAYYGFKRPVYELMIKHEGLKEYWPVELGIKLCNDIAKYKVTHFASYFSQFDKTAIKNTFGENPMFDNLVEIDLWTLAVTKLLNSKKFGKWAVANDKVTESGNIQTKAETCYQYLIGNPDYQEDHMALSDCKIEYEILKAIWKSKVKNPASMVMSQPWRLLKPLSAALVTK